MIDRLALSCLGLRSSYLNPVSHGDKMTAPRTHMVLCTLTESVRDKVCSASVRAACILTHLHEAILATKSRSRRAVQPWTHCRPPACPSWNCRVQDFRAHVVQHTAWHRLCKRHVLFFNWVCADAVEQHVSLHLVWYVISWPRNCWKIPVIVMATIVTCRNASTSS